VESDLGDKKPKTPAGLANEEALFPLLTLDSVSSVFWLLGSVAFAARRAGMCTSQRRNREV